MEKEKAVRKRFSTVGKIIVAMAVLAIAGILICVIGYETIRTAVVRAAITVVAGTFYTLWLWGQN